jgi:hypothetical protein
LELILIKKIRVNVIISLTCGLKKIINNKKKELNLWFWYSNTIDGTGVTGRGHDPPKMTRKKNLRQKTKKSYLRYFLLIDPSSKFLLLVMTLVITNGKMYSITHNWGLFGFVIFFSIILN